MMFVRTKKTILFYIGFVLFWLLFACNVSAQSATLLVSPTSGTFEKDKTFSVKIMVESTSDMNAAEVGMAFDSKVLSVTSISKSGSAFSLWTTEPSFSNTKGIINFGGGSPTPFTGKKTLATVVFKAKDEGVGTVSFTSGNVLAADGKGTDILSGKEGGEYTVSAKKTEEKPIPPEPKNTTGTTPGAPIVTSSEFADVEKWYADTEATFKWNLAYDITSVRLLFDGSPASTPSVTYTPPISEKTLTDLEEGEWYLHVMFKNDAGWGVPVHHKILIDLAPPDDFSMRAEQKDLYSQDVTLIFKTTDDLSGIDRYEIILDGVLQGTVLSDDLVEGSHTFYVANHGPHKFSVKAFDSAGNFVEAKIDLTVEKALVSKKQVPVLEEEEGQGFNWQYWITLFFVAIIAFLSGSMMYERRSIRNEKEHIKKEADEAREKLEAIFVVLRDEIEEQVISLATKPNMTESERQILEKLKEALEISEELLDKEIEDVRKLVQ